VAKLPKLEQEYTGVNPDTGEYMSPAERKIAFAKRTGKDVRKMPKMSSTTVGGAFGGMKGGALVKQDRLFKVEQEIGEANKSLVEIRSILEKDFERKIQQDKDEIADLQTLDSKQKFKQEEKSLEKKNLGDKIKGQAEKGLKPFKSMTDKLIELATFLTAGFLGNAAFEFLKDPAVRDAWKSITKFMIKQLGWISKTIGSFIGFFSFKNLFGLFKKAAKFVLNLPKKIFNFVKSLFKIPKKIGRLFKKIGIKVQKVAKKVKNLAKTIAGIIKKVTNFLKGGVGKVLGFGKNLLKKGKNVVKSSTAIVKSGVKNLGKTGAKTTAKTAAKAAGKGAGKSVLKKIPFVGLGLGAAFAVDRLRKGDWAGALMELGSGAASMIPGVGTAVSAGIDIALIAKDIGDAKKKRAEGGEVTPAKTGRGVTKGQRLIVGEKGPEILEAPFTGTVKHNTETMNTLKSEGGSGVEVIETSLPPVMTKPAEIADDATTVANPAHFIESMNKLNDYMKTTPEVLGMTV